MLSQKLLDALNDQLNAEYYSSYLYLAMSAHCEAESFRGMAHWLREQSKEEMEHAMKFYDFILSRGARVQLKELPTPPNHWASPLAVFEATLAHERHITERIHKLLDLAVAEHDHPGQVFLHWFVNEQVEEEAAAQLIVDRMKMVGDSPGGLLILDRELGAR